MPNWATAINSVINTIGTNIGSVWGTIKGTGTKPAGQGGGGGVVTVQQQPRSTDWQTVALFAAAGALVFVLVRK